MRYEKRKIVVLVSMLALIVCVSVVNNQLSKKDALSASAGYEDYETKQMQMHDGEVLVDSINVVKVPGKSQDSVSITNKEGDEAQETLSESTQDETSVVTSDNLEELKNTDTYFEEVRATINMDRNEILSMLTAVIDETKDGPEKKNATQQKLKIIDYMNKEKVVENLIENKGFADALVLITDTSVNVTVNKQELSQTDVAKIYDIVMRETERNADQIVIQSKF
ncbi:SpoIIIAH-like family protein [Sinanaerobacter sp. ZZT-01]|uniref:SpoIIIAH-like family protein n=1 Tax=Sinanaerobacter sp. ZZT-01 TaxID=3111540 RepID=UPI002D79D0D2|nr:SpoIIIAH-like family protein [Sinanaerobacter sp. ZZT-01]WRR93130.1 SpoIIIAH-like family protein [Sinanaerobacter sp. ZZT-01]